MRNATYIKSWLESIGIAHSGGFTGTDDVILLQDADNVWETYTTVVLAMRDNHIECQWWGRPKMNTAKFFDSDPQQLERLRDLLSTIPQLRKIKMLEGSTLF